jgi:hypothetical protein
MGKHLEPCLLALRLDHRTEPTFEKHAGGERNRFEAPVLGKYVSGWLQHLRSLRENATS